MDARDAEQHADRALTIVREHPGCSQAAIIGRVSQASSSGRVTATGALGAERVLDLLSGEQLPRIC